MSEIQKVRVRIAPSPTGNLHIGTARTALFNYLFAKKHKGTFVIRIEDTDKERSKKEFERSIFDSLSWLGIESHETYRQSERTTFYKQLLEKLISEDKAYISKETPKEVGGRTEVIRFRNPNKVVSFEDIIRGTISFDTTELGDFVIAKSLEEPVFHFANVADDFDMKITHIIRGEDHISNTPRQILIAEALGAPRPLYAHIPLILAPDKSKLSKRHGAVSLIEYQEKGYLKDALINFLALLGFNPGGEKELFTLDELISLFDLEKVQKGGAVFNEEKLKWFNREYILRLPKDVIEKEVETRFTKAQIVCDHALLSKIVPLITDRIHVLADIDTLISIGEFSYIMSKPIYEKAKLLWKNDTDFSSVARRLREVSTLILSLPDVFTSESIKSLIMPYAEKEGKGSVLWPMRFSLSGRDKSPDPFVLSSILGKKETIERLSHAVSLITADEHHS